MNNQDPIIDILNLALELEQNKSAREVIDRAHSAKALRFIAEAHRVAHESSNESQVEQVIESLAKLIDAVEGVTAAIKK